ncbi:hypothetical protein BKA83DRAFT_4218545 [Pisolithus microcarpus]|nr:hypothetical protein BKA83DRAFT_4218545 [Pisolithus microcarpus]
MATHQCVDWSRNPPARKLDVLVLSHGDTHIYAVVPKLFKDLDRLAREEFNLGGADLEFYSSCIKLCNVDVPARIGEHVWEYISSLIGCLFVIAREPTVNRARESEATSHPSPPPPEQSVRPSIHDGESELPVNEDEPHDSSYSTADKTGGEGVPEGVDLPTDGGNIEIGEEGGNSSPGKGGVSSPVEDTRTTDDEQGAQGNGIIMRKRPARQNLPESEEEEPVARRRRIVKSGQEETSPPSSSQFGTRGPTARSRKRMPRSPTKPSRDPAEEYELMDDMTFGSQRRGVSHSRSRSIKDEKTIVNSPSTSGYREPEPEPVFTQVPRGTQQEGQERIYIIVAHRPSKQESKFAVKGSTKVSKVISSVCKSFTLDASHAKLFLIIDTTDEDGIMENLFPCDVDDSMMRAGAEPSNESKFLLMLPGDP